MLYRSNYIKLSILKNKNNETLTVKSSAFERLSYVDYKSYKNKQFFSFSWKVISLWTLCLL